MDDLVGVLSLLLCFANNAQTLSLQDLATRAPMTRGSSDLYVPRCWTSSGYPFPQGSLPDLVQTPVNSSHAPVTKVVWGPKVTVTCEQGEEAIIFLNSSRLFVEDGRVMLGWTIDRNSGNTYDYCIKALATEEAGEYVPSYAALFCYLDPCKDRVCVDKCCPRGELFEGTSCVTNNLTQNDWTPKDDTFYISESRQLTTNSYGMPTFTLDAYGYLRGVTDVAPRHFCIDYNSEDGKVTEIAIVYEPTEVDNSYDCSWMSEVLKIVLMSLSVIFLLANLLVYLCVPVLRKRDHHWPLICMIISLLLTFIIHICLRKLRTQLDLMCKHLGMLALMFTLASFFWMNIMSFSVWRKLQSVRTVTMDKRTFAWYNVYAWGVPLLVCAVGYAMDSLQPGNNSPNFPKYICWFNGNGRAKWMYYYGIMALLQAVNIFFFLHIAWKMAMWRWNSLSGNSTQQRANILPHLYINLAVIMGMAWTLEFFSSGDNCGVWQILCDGINSLQGVFIFIVTVCNRNKLTEPYFPRQLQPKIWRVYCAVDAHNDRFCWPLLAYHLLAVLTNALTTILPHLDKKHLWHLQTFFTKLYVMLLSATVTLGNFPYVIRPAPMKVKRASNYSRNLGR